MAAHNIFDKINNGDHYTTVSFPEIPMIARAASPKENKHKYTTSEFIERAMALLKSSVKPLALAMGI